MPFLSKRKTLIKNLTIQCIKAKRRSGDCSEDERAVTGEVA